MISLAGRRIVVVEATFLLAMEFDSILQEAGALVIRPCDAREDAQRGLSQHRADRIVLDVNLGDDSASDVFMSLRVLGASFLFFACYNQSATPPEFADVARLEKPVDATQMLLSVKKCSRSPPWRKSPQSASCRADTGLKCAGSLVTL